MNGTCGMRNGDDDDGTERTVVYWVADWIGALTVQVGMVWANVYRCTRVSDEAIWVV